MTTFLEGKTALVTGSTSGIGLEISRQLAKAGCKVMLNGVDAPSVVEEAIADLRSSGVDEVYFKKADLLDPLRAEQLIAGTLERFNSIDILVNNAGIQHVAPIDAFSNEDWDQLSKLTCRHRSTSSARFCR